MWQPPPLGGLQKKPVAGPGSAEWRAADGREAEEYQDRGPDTSGAAGLGPPESVEAWKNLP